MSQFASSSKSPKSLIPSRVRSSDPQTSSINSLSEANERQRLIRLASRGWDDGQDESALTNLESNQPAEESSMAIQDQDQENNEDWNMDEEEEESSESNFEVDIGDMGLDTSAEADSMFNPDEVNQPSSSAFRVEMAMAESKQKEKASKIRTHDRRIFQLVTKTTIPNHSSTISRALRSFIQFLMGMPETVMSYPHPPSLEETVKWQKMHSLRFNKLKAHFQEFRQSISNHPKCEQKVLMKQEEIRVNSVITPPSFSASRDHPSKGFNIPLVTKRTCEQKLQAAGFSRVTFDWSASPFSSSSWNQSISLIIADTFNSWVKTTAVLECKEIGELVLMIGRWVRGQGQLISRESKRPGITVRKRSENAISAQKSRMKKQIANLRMQTARLQFPQSLDFVGLFSSANMVSDFEDAQGSQSPIRIIPGWRSETFTNCINGLDKVAKLTCDSKKKLASAQRLLERSDTHQGKCSSIIEAPKFLPEDAYCPNFLASLSEVERNALKRSQSINLSSFHTTLLQRTSRS